MKFVSFHNQRNITEFPWLRKVERTSWIWHSLKSNARATWKWYPLELLRTTGQPSEVFEVAWCHAWHVIHTFGVFRNARSRLDSRSSTHKFVRIDPKCQCKVRKMNKDYLAFVFKTNTSSRPIHKDRFHCRPIKTAQKNKLKTVQWKKPKKMTCY